MKHLLPFFVMFILTGCSWFTHRTDSSAVPADLFSDKTELVMSRAAAAVEVARAANKDGKPQVVENELSVASAYLPRPSVEDVEFAKKRTESKDSAVYSKALNVADSHNKKLNELRAAVEAEKQKAKDAIEAQEKKYEADRRMLITMIVAGVGGLGVAAGIAMLLLGFNKMNAFASIVTGVGVIASATVFEAPWFGWLAAGTITTFIIEAWGRLRCQT